MNDNKEKLKQELLKRVEDFKQPGPGMPAGSTADKVMPPLIKTDVGGKVTRAIREENKRSQAQRVIAKFGGVYQMRDILRAHGWNIAPSTIYRWTYPRQDPRYPTRRGGKTGFGGTIPPHQLERIAKIARLEGIHIEASDYDTRRL